MKIAICDDDLTDIRTIRDSIIAHPKAHEIVEFTSASPFLRRIHGGENFDLLFLDVQMPDSDGWEIAKDLKQSKVKTIIAMITIMGEYIYDCFDRVDWFAPKPVSSERIHKIIDNAYDILYPKAFEFQAGEIKITLTAPEIIYAESSRNDIYIHTTNGNYKVRLALWELEKMLSEISCFVRIHHGIVINLAYIDKVEGNDVILKSRVRLPLSRNKRKPFFAASAQYIRCGHK